MGDDLTRGQRNIEYRPALILLLFTLFLVLFSCTTVQAPKTITLTGVLLTQDTDARKQFPVRNAQITATYGPSTAETTSDNAGLFHLILSVPGPAVQPVTLSFRHPDYKPLDRTETAGDHLYVAHMVPIPRKERENPNRPEVVISSSRVRYSVKTTNAQNVASLSHAFEVVNSGNIPCNGSSTCSPDGKWKATLYTYESDDAGEGNEFRNVRVSCIAGPCPFTHYDYKLDQGGRRIKVSVLDWSDTATFLVEAEITHTMVNNLVRLSYPVVFGEAMDFTLPAGAEGASIEAELNGFPIVFPLGPDNIVSWAKCTAKVAGDGSTLYRCEVKPGYRYKQ